MLATFHLAVRRNGDGEEGIAVVVRRPMPAMERMVVEVARGLDSIDGDDDVIKTEACHAAALWYADTDTVRIQFFINTRGC
uniref:Uncharacterized protein n=1 Tax=Leersia perrieri TaxID=77586 RepID=A0A0D9WD11_9ORYZ